MKQTLLTAAIALALGASRALAAPVAPVDDAVSIEFVDVDGSDATLTAAGREAWLDLNTVRNDDRSNDRVMRIRRRFGVRTVRAGSTSTGNVTITAHLQSLDGRATYRLDGRVLTTASQIVEAHARVGAVTLHTLDIEVPTTASEGPLAVSIAWEVTTD